MFCKQCGKEIPDDSALCCYCGTQVTHVPQPEEQPEIPAEEMPAPVQEEAAPKQEKPKKKNLLWLWIGLGVAALAAVGGLVWFLLSKNEEQPANPEMVTVWMMTHYNGEPVSSYTYDEQGRITSWAITSYAYDKWGNIVEETKTTNGVEASRKTWVYDEQGHELEYVAYKDGVETSRETRAYDAQGNLIEEVGYRNGEEFYRASYIYDKNNRLVERNGMTLTDVVLYGGDAPDRYTYQYDASGNVVKIAYQNGTEVSRDTYNTNTYDGTEHGCTFDDQGNLIEADNGRLHIVYDAQGNKVEKTANFGTVGETYTYTYDENGNRVQEKMYRNGEEYQTVTYTYADDGTMVRISYDANGTELECRTYQKYEMTRHQAEVLCAQFYENWREYYYPYLFPDRIVMKTMKKLGSNEWWFT